MTSGDLLLLRGDEITELFRGQEATVVDVIRAAYCIKEQGDVAIPNCPFLRFPENAAARIIAKPAYVGGQVHAAGLKWIASFPSNLNKGIDRASATIILNCPETGVPLAVMEGSVISAYRTAASAALAASVLCRAQPRSLGIIGCGLINFETLRFILALQPSIETILVHELSSVRAAQFAAKSEAIRGSRSIQVAASAEALLTASDVTSLATTATVPYIKKIDGVPQGSVLLHISLRDFMPAAVLAADNVVDDVEHVCSNGTSLDLTATQEGNRSFIRTTLGAILLETAPRHASLRPVMFSPFGLGVLDIALAHAALGLAHERGAGTVIPKFLPAPWVARPY